MSQLIEKSADTSFWSGSMFENLKIHRQTLWLYECEYRWNTQDNKKK